MAGDEIGVAADVTGIGPDGRVSRFHRCRHRRIGNRPAQPAVAGRLQLAIPSGLRQPDFDADVGVTGRRQLQRHATERRERLERRGRIRVGRVRRRERAGWHGLGRQHASVRHAQSARAIRTQSAQWRAACNAPSVAAASRAIPAAILMRGSVDHGARLIRRNRLIRAASEVGFVCLSWLHGFQRAFIKSKSSLAVRRIFRTASWPICGAIRLGWSAIA